MVPVGAEIDVQEPVGTTLLDGSATVAFGKVALGSSITRLITIRNAGSLTLSGLAVEKADSGVSEFTLGALSTTSLAPGAFTSFTVRYAPTQILRRTLGLRIHSNDADENPFDLIVTGTGFNPATERKPEIVVKGGDGRNLVDGSSVIDFGDVAIDTRATLEFTIRNAGNGILDGLAINVSGAQASEFKLRPLAETFLTPGSEITFTVTFEPSAKGKRATVLKILSNDANENPFNVQITGKGIAPVPPAGPEIVVKPAKGKALVSGRSKVQFKPVSAGKTGKPMVFTIKNTGDQPLKRLGVRLKGKDSGDFKIVRLRGKTLPPGKSVRFTISFSPRSRGLQKAELNISSNDADENPFSVTLQGTAR